MTSVTPSRVAPLKHSYEEIRMMENLTELLQRHETLLLQLSERLQSLDQRISQLERPTLMYRRPSGKDYESVSDTLDYLHNNVEGLKQDLLKVARAV
jgi:predicted nuclease with TOPRIM domain